MEYKTIDKKNYSLHLIKTNRFKMINVVLFLTKKFNKNDITLLNVLSNNMMYTSKKYNTKNKISIAGEELFGAKVSCTFGLFGSCEGLAITLDFLNPKYTEKEYLEKSFDYFCEILFNPNIENNGFNKEYFDIIKKDIYSSIKSVKDNPNTFASSQYAKLMYKGTPSEYSNISNIKDLNKVTPENLYEFYKKLYDGEYRTDLFVHGDFEEKEIIDIINKKFKKLNTSNEKFNLFIDKKYSYKVLEKVDSLKFNQSKLYMGYSLNNLTFHEMNHVLNVYNTILGTMNDSILFNIVREKNSLCYSIGSYVNKYNPSITIYAGINKDNYEKTVELVKKCVSLMKDKNTIKRLFDSAKKTINTYLNNYYDDITSQVNKYFYGQFEEIEDIETKRENINNVTIEEVIELNNKISLSTIYLLKGDINYDKENI